MPRDRTTHATLLVGIALALTVGAGLASAAGPIDVPDRSVAVDERTTVPITVSEVPDGVQRYNVTVHLDAPAVARIESAAAGDVEGFQVRSRTADAVTFRAADLSEGVGAGATNVTLGTVTVSGATPGESALLVTTHDFRTDAAEQVDPSIAPGTLTVGADGGAAGARAGADGGTLDELASTLPGTPALWAVGGLAASLLVVAVVLRRR